VHEAAASAVFLVAQNRLLREALAKILSQKTDIAVVGSCALAPESVSEVITALPDVLVMDSWSITPGRIELVRELQRHLNGIKLVLIGMEPDETSFLQAIREGTVGYLLKDASAAEVVSAIRAVAAGEGVCPPQLLSYLFRYVAQRCQMPSFQVRANLGLTNREQQLVWLISKGLTNKEIASQLKLAEQTVRNHVHRMLRKVGASHRLAVVEICRLQGLPV
jgi:DNA-binding NarL/FixJ family response regulator